VRENLEFPLKAKIRPLDPAEIATRVERAAKTLRIDHLLDRKTDRLSGGEMQRVSIGRAIVRKPRIFLMDEPLSALDAKLREALRTELKNLQMTLGATFLFVTHDQVEAMSWATGSAFSIAAAWSRSVLQPRSIAIRGTPSLPAR
jgi:multiple sugar transport system ATP-binding protein